MPRVLIYAPSDRIAQEASFRLRLHALAALMKSRGFEWNITVRPKSPWKRIKLAKSARQFDAVILQRKWLDPLEAHTLRHFVARDTKASQSAPRRPRIFMDIDDATMLHETQLGLIARWRLERRFHATLDILDAACPGNEYLGSLLQKNRRPAAPPLVLRIIPTAVDPAQYAVKNHVAATPVRLVWLGSASTLKYLEEASAALQAAAAAVPGLTLCVICDRAPGSLPLPVEFIPWSLESEKPAILRGDIGIAPMPDNRWTQGKCGFKIIQYMAAGLPVVASPAGVNGGLVHGAGLLAQSPAEWAGAIARLAGDVQLRRAYGAAGRRRVETDFSLQRVADLWAKALGG